MRMKCKCFFALFEVMCIGLLAPLFSENHQCEGNSQTIDSVQQRKITPAASPRIANGVNAFLILDCFYWKAVQEGTGFAAQGGITDLNGGSSNVNRGSIQSIGTDWNWGFKIGGGLNLNHDGWDLLAYYTWFRPESEKKIAEIKGAFILPLRFTRFGYASDIFNQIAVKTVQSTWNLRYDEINLEWGRDSHFSQFLTLRPFWGIKGTWQNQTLKATYLHFYNPSLVLFGPYLIEEHFKVIGFGSRGGFDMKWYLSENFSFFGRLAGSILWAHYYKQSRKDILTSNYKDINTNIDLIGNRNDIKYVVESELGISWENWCYDDGYHLSAQLGWSSQIWFNWAHFFEPYRENWYNLNMSGLICKFRLDF